MSPTLTAPARTARLMADDDAGRPADLTAHQLVDLVKAAGLGGRGGAGFPTWRKIETVATGRGRPVVIGNAAEGEPASGKDAWLLANRPNLVLDGLSLAAGALGSGEVYLYVGPAALVAPLQTLAHARHASGRDRRRIQVVAAPDAFLAGEETAAVSWIDGRPAAPRTKPPLVVHQGLHGRPTLVQNVETLAHLTLIARHGADWFRAAGTTHEPGTMLLTVSGAVHRPGILEAAHGSPVPELLERAGGLREPASAALFGGYHGGWVRAEDLPGAVLSRPALASLGASLGAGVVAVLPARACGVRESARVLAYLSRESAGQCGPCLNGLPRMATLFADLARGRPDRRVLTELHRLAGMVEGRGACHHPDGTIRFLRSALDVFDTEVRAHLHGGCTAGSHAPVLPTPGPDPRRA